MDKESINDAAEQLYRMVEIAAVEGDNLDFNLEELVRDICREVLTRANVDNFHVCPLCESRVKK
jgi:hypothetical protein